MSLLLNILVDGMAFSMVLFMITIGLAMTLGLMHLVNMAHGVFAMLAGLVTAYLITTHRLPFLLAALVGLAATAALAVPVERLLIRSFYRRSPMDQMLMTMGIAFIATAACSLVFGARVMTIPLPDWLSGSLAIGDRRFPVHRAFVVGVGLATLLALYLTIDRSRYGVLVRASVDNASIAETVGINTRLVYVSAFTVGAVLAGLGGIVGAELLPLEPNYPMRYLAVLLAVVAVSGHGNLFGSFVSSVILGMGSTAAKYLYPEMSSIVFFGIMFLVLKFRPHGILGR